LLLGAVISAQQPPSRFRAGVDLVTVDAVVLDKDGNPVPGLTRQDFEVEEDGRVQQITEFQSVELPPPSATPRPARPAPERRISFNSITAGHIPGRAFVLVFDDINLTRVQAAEGKKALRKFVETATTDEDSVSIITTSGGGWFHARTAADRQKLLALADREEGKYIEDTSAERMTDFEAMRITVFQDTTVAARVRRRYANYRVNGMQPVTTPGGVDDMPRIEETRGNVGVVEPYIESRASAVYSEIVARNRMTLGVLERALKALEDTRGRKSVVLLSKGFIYDPETRGFKAVSQAARRANVAIYFVDARGLVATTSNFTASEGSPIDPRDIGADVRRHCARRRRRRQRRRGQRRVRHPQHQRSERRSGPALARVAQLLPARVCATESQARRKVSPHFGEGEAARTDGACATWIFRA
jgi:VWFA-related protein